MKPYYEHGGVTIYHGDCREVLPTLGQVATCVLTDPPYGLEFMGKEWDKLGAGVEPTKNSAGGTEDRPGIGNAYSRSRIRYGTSAATMQAWFTEHFAAILGACLPGAPLLAFGGTRTHHRLMCGIEDAGFEIRDCLMWLYGSGFSKGFNMRRAGLCECGGNAIPYDHAKQTAEHDLRPVPDADLSPPVDAADKPGEVLLKGLPEPGASAEGQARTESETGERAESGMEGRELHRAGEGLSDDPKAGPPEGETERIRSGAHLDCRADAGPPARAWRGSTPQERRASRQPPRESQGVQDAPGALGDAPHGGGSCCPRCGKLSQAWEGYSSNLKPAYEPIVLAMKPLDGTFAQNAERWGVSGLNVDGGRIGTAGRPEITKTGETWAGSNMDCAGSRATGTTAVGRFPANLILDEEAAAMLDRQAGDCPSSEGVRPRGTGNQVYGKHRDTPFLSYGDNGGPSRFFYTSKAGKEDRGPDNDHPTVKPLDLLRYLLKLLAPPEGGVVLDPFMGSGTTIQAAKYMHLGAIGIEIEERYCEIAAERLSQEVLPL